MRRDAAVEERRRVRDADALVGQVEERIVELPRVVQVEHAAAQLVDLVRAPDVRIGERDRGVAIGALQRERRREAGRIRERIESRELRVEHRGAEPVVRR